MNTEHSPLDLARERQRELRESGEFEMLDPVEKAKRNPQSRQLAIAAFCCQCMGGPGEAGYRGHIRNCTAPTCPLYQFRPYKPGGD